jgi:hypothetical protein
VDRGLASVPLFVVESVGLNEVVCVDCRRLYVGIV